MFGVLLRRSCCQEFLEYLGAVAPDLSEPDLSEPDLSEPDLSDPDLSDPDLSEPDLSEPDLSDPDLSEPVLLAWIHVLLTLTIVRYVLPLPLTWLCDLCCILIRIEHPVVLKPFKYNQGISDVSIQ